MANGSGWVPGSYGQRVRMVKDPRVSVPRKIAAQKVPDQMQGIIIGGEQRDQFWFAVIDVPNKTKSSDKFVIPVSHLWPESTYIAASPCFWIVKHSNGRIAHNHPHLNSSIKQNDGANDSSDNASIGSAVVTEDPQPLLNELVDYVNDIEEADNIDTVDDLFHRLRPSAAEIDVTPWTDEEQAEIQQRGGMLKDFDQLGISMKVRL